MKKIITAVLLSLMLLTAVNADSEAPAPETETAEAADTGSKALSTYLLISGVIGAMVVVTLIYRGHDKGKYL